MFKRLKSEEDGAVAVITALVLVVLMAAVALTVDVGGLLLRKREMVNGADAAALAAAITYVENGDTSDTDAVALDQFKSNSPGSVSNSKTGIEATALKWVFEEDGSGSVTVQYRTSQPLYFAPVIGFDSEHDVASTATAYWEAGSIGAGGTYTFACGDPSDPLSVPCSNGDHIAICHWDGNYTTGKYNPIAPSTTSSGPSGGHYPEHEFDVFPSYKYNPNKQFKGNGQPNPQYKASETVVTPGMNWPILTNVPEEFQWALGMSSSSFVGGDCSGEGPHVWLGK